MERNMPKSIQLIGAPVDSGKRRAGCLMGPDAYRTSGLASALRDLGHDVVELANLSPQPVEAPCPEPLFKKILLQFRLAPFARDENRSCGLGERSDARPSRDFGL